MPGKTIYGRSRRYFANSGEGMRCPRVILYSYVVLLAASLLLEQPIPLAIAMMSGSIPACS